MISINAPVSCLARPKASRRASDVNSLNPDFNHR
jgi:hypothetical protein